MTDLSTPSPALLSKARPALLWPTPPYAAYPAPLPLGRDEPCEIEGPNGHVTRGRLAYFDAEAGIAHLVVPPARGTITLRLAQFRRMTLLHPVYPLNPDTVPGDDLALPDATAQLLATAPLTPCRLRHRGGQCTEVASLGHVDHALGLFLFPPADEHGGVLRSLYPHAGLEAAEFGPRVGDVLVDHAAATRSAVDDTAAHQTLLRERPLGELLVSERIVAPAQLIAAIDQQARMPLVRIGEALLALGFIDERQLGDALAQQMHERHIPLGELLVQRGVVTWEELQIALARKMGYPVVDAGEFPVENEAALRLPQSVARRLGALPLMLRGGRIVIALEDPSARLVIDELEFNVQAKVVPVLARAGTLVPALERVYQRLGFEALQGTPDASAAASARDADPQNANQLLANLETQAGLDLRDDAPPIEQSDNSLVRLINTMIQEAQAAGVSDIHIECPGGREKVRIRFRRDGLLRPYLELPPNYRAALVARLKIMCDLDISERRKPQDGKIAFGRFVQGQALELRVATIPTANGLEDVVLRLLASARAMPLDAMALAPANLARFKTAIERPYGLVLCVGPTGSGKTTTLHAALGHLNTPERKIWTAEDPVEITQRGLRQVQVNPRIDWTFAKALRALLRADPDVVMVGEIRDQETAQTAIEASLTGHLVMSTLHTNSAAETVTRLLDMGMDPFSFADSLLAVLAQRLVRRLCRHCASTRAATPEQVDALLDDWLGAFVDAAQRPDRDATRAEWIARHGRHGALLHHHAVGCDQCGHTGFSGRLGMHELLVVDRELRHLIQTNATAAQLQRAAMAHGLRTLRQDGIEKVLAGWTTIEEVRATSNA